ncbi:hypothetical protein M8J76_005306 [Diaphorina citri]|nr:hypothetical protein M8J76_005306 [Diaphorina citri]
MTYNIRRDEHAWKSILKVAHIMGLISLPHFYKEPWKNVAHSYYSTGVSILMLVGTMSLLVNTLFYSIRDVAELCERSIETVLVLVYILESVYLKLNLTKFLRIADFFEAVCIYHTKNQVVVAYKQRENYLVKYMSIAMILVYIGVTFVAPFLPRTQSQLLTMQRIYKWKNPHNTLPIYMYIPFIDITEMRYYVPLCIMQMCLGLLILVAGYIALILMPLTTISLQVHYDLLNDYTKIMGTIHYNPSGQRVFHMNVRKGVCVEVESLFRGKRRKELNSRVYQEYEYYFMKQLIQYHQELRLMRRKIDSYLKVTWILRTGLMGPLLCTCMYALLTPGLLSTVIYNKFILESIGFLMASLFVFLAGELLASFNLTWRSALYNSPWYKCSNKTKKVIPLLLLLNQTHDYHSLNGLIPCSHEYMVRMIKMAYSVFNLLRTLSDLGTRIATQLQIDLTPTARPVGKLHATAMSLKCLTLLAGVCLLACRVNAANERLKELFAWKTVDFDFPDEATRAKAIENKEYIQENNLPLGLERWHDKLFVTIPRWKSGIVSTLNYINLTEAKGNLSPNLKPYPSYEINNIHKKNGTTLVSGFRINVDVCDRLWMVDTGLADILGEGNQISTPRIVVIDLKTDKIIKEHTIAKEDIAAHSFFANILVDTTPNTCDKAFAYIPDLGGFQMIVYDLENNESYKVKHHYFYFDPLSGNYNVGGVNFQWTDGVFGVALSPVHKEDGYRTLYFHPLSSTREFSVNTKILQNKTTASNSYYEFKVLGSRGPNSQATAESLDEKTGVLFYTQVNKDGVGCWNSYKHANEYSADTTDLVATDSETLVFPNDLKVDKEGYLWVLSDKLPVHIHKGLHTDEINYRIFQTPVKDAIKGTVCDV